MIKKIAEIIKYLGNLLMKFSKLIHTDVQENRAKMWYAQVDNKTLRFEYDLNEESIVFDLGGYEGQWASDIYAKYRCKVFVFEPIKNYASEIENRFNKNKDIKVFAFGLSDITSKAKISLLDDSSSVFKNDENSQEIELVAFREFIATHSISKIDLIKINIEGGEFPLLEDIIKDSAVSKISNFQIQFHDFVEDSDNRMKHIQNQLSKTHYPTYQIEYIWENWKLKY